jgi:hypothetical protein
VLVVWTDDSVGTFGPNGSVVSSPFDDEPTPSDVSSSGSMVAADGSAYRAVVYDRGGLQRPRIVIQMDALRRGELSPVAAGVGFAPAVGDAGPYLLVAEIAIDGPVLRRYRALPLGAEDLDFELIASDPTPALPSGLSGGDLDRDGELDIAALITFGDIDRGGQLRVFAALEVDHLGERLRGLSPATDASRPQMLLADLNGDGAHEVALATANQLIIAGAFAP